MITFISGGARSGKSSFAENMALTIFKKARKTKAYVQLLYIATAKRSDHEMVQRIDRHQNERAKYWKTIEEPHFISKVLLKANSEDVILIDCLTVWLSNMMFDLDFNVKQFIEAVDEWLRIVRHKGLSLIIVSNDLNEGLPQSNLLVNDYIFILESLHKRIVNEADYAVEVITGIPTYWKGEKR
ncbi:bifunctional adenosylcobinamide kinase/adenosylcobinamide-phosphate guanylyltransferase [Anaerobacillus arseniciselenatis]|nr:bifunctional adenosylcobinamide kinase/adenosylcobinamide-phosphate guanylyltransferase [Anaerobacillus arseniciselenatis]